MDELFFSPARQISAMIRNRELSCTELVEALLDRIARVDPALNAFGTVAGDQALATATHLDEHWHAEDSRLLLGVPVPVKDNIETAGIRTTYGSRVFATHVPDQDAVCVERLRRAGAIVIGKTNLPEFAAKGVADSPVFGHARNPWDLSRTTGGSSGGSAAAVAAGLGPIALGNDQAGSVRMPAAFCGVAGLKPTAGRVPFAPNEAPWDFVFHVGMLARAIDDLDLALQVLSGPDGRDPLSLPSLPEHWATPVGELTRNWRIAWSPTIGFARVDAEVLAATSAAVSVFTGVADVQEASMDLCDAELAYSTLIPIRRAAVMGHHLDDWAALMDPFVADYVRSGLDRSVGDLGAGLAARSRLYAEVERVLKDADLIITPTLSVTAFGVGEQAPSSIDGVPVSSWRDWFPFTYPFNLTGHPAASVPAGLSSGGLPIGLQIVGRRFADRDVLAACAYLESELPWAQHRPPAGSSTPPARPSPPP